MQANETGGVAIVAVACAGEGPRAVPLWGTVEEVGTKFTCSRGDGVWGWAIPKSSAAWGAAVAKAASMMATVGLDVFGFAALTWLPVADGADEA